MILYHAVVERCSTPLRPHGCFPPRVLFPPYYYLSFTPNPRGVFVLSDPSCVILPTFKNTLQCPGYV